MGWYKCPNGHIYSVGNCTMPMQTARCTHPHCSAIIGGSNHTPAAGNRRLDEKGLLGNIQPGYVVLGNGTPVDYTLYGSNRGSVTSTAIIRFLIHLALRVMVEGSRFAHESFVLTKLGAKDISERADQDWAMLQDRTGLSSDDLFLALHIILQDSAAYLHASAAAYTAPAARSQLERGVDLCANRLLASDRVLRSRLSEARANFSPASMFVKCCTWRGNGASRLIRKWTRLSNRPTGLGAEFSSSRSVILLASVKNPIICKESCGY